MIDDCGVLCICVFLKFEMIWRLLLRMIYIYIFDNGNDMKQATEMLCKYKKDFNTTFSSKLYTSFHPHNT